MKGARFQVIVLFFSLVLVLPRFIDAVERSATAEWEPEWIGSFTMPPGSGLEEGHSLTLDSDGNLYVAGYCDLGYYAPDPDYLGTLIKYDSAGSQLWQIFSDTINPQVVRTDAADQVYLGGGSLQKYGENGNLMWKNSEVTNITHLGFDGAGNIYGGGAYSVYGLQASKVDSDGNLLWQSAHIAPETVYFWPSNMAVDNAGRAYLNGTACLEQNEWWECLDSEFVAVIFDPDGNEIAAPLYHGTEYGPNYSNDLALDSAGQLYVTGASCAWWYQPYPSGDPFCRRFSFVTIKYDAEGQELWSATYLGPDGGYYEPGSQSHLVIDSQDDIYVVGFFGEANIIEYDSDGNQLWAGLFEEAWINFMNEVVMDEAGDLLVLGGDVDYLVERYNSVGDLLSLSEYDYGTEEPAEMAAGSGGRVFVTGLSTALATSDDVATVGFEENGNPFWSARYDGLGYWGSDNFQLQANDQGESFVAASINYDYWEETGDYLTVKFDADGQPAWSAVYGSQTGMDQVAALGLDAADNVFVAGSASTPTPRQWVSHHRAFTTIKYNAAGGEEWVALLDQPNADNTIRAMAVTPEGEAVVAGCTEDYDLGQEFLIIKYSASGGQSWRAYYSASLIETQCATAVTIDADGFIYVTGTAYAFGEPDERENYATLKYNKYGQRKWVALYNSPPVGYDLPVAIAVDAEGVVVVTGASDFKPATVKYDAEGHELWVARDDNYLNQYYGGQYLMLDGAGNVYVVAGLCPDGAALDCDDHDIVAIKYDSDGQLVWKKRYGESAALDNQAHGAALNPAGRLDILGRTRYYESNQFKLVLLQYNLGGDLLLSEEHPQNMLNPQTMGLDPAGNVYAAATLDRDIVVLKYPPGDLTIDDDTADDDTVDDDTVDDDTTDDDTEPDDDTVDDDTADDDTEPDDDSTPTDDDAADDDATDDDLIDDDAADDDATDDDSIDDDDHDDLNDDLDDDSAVDKTDDDGAGDDGNDDNDSPCGR